MLTLENELSKSKLEFLYLTQKLSDAEIAKMYNVSGGRIHRLRNRYNINAIEYYQRHHKQELDNKEKEFLVGSILGDGHIRWRNQKDKRAYPQLMLEQSTKHSEYAFWLKDQVKDWLFDQDKILKQARKITKGIVHHSYPFQTICHPVFIEFYNGFYVDRKKVVNIDFIKKYFSPFSLAVWLMDDGTISKNRNIAICSHSFTKEENEILSQFILEKFNIKSVLWENNIAKIPLYYLAFSKEDSIKIKELVQEYFVPSMLHKLSISSETTKESYNQLIV